MAHKCKCKRTVLTLFAVKEDGGIKNELSKGDPRFELKCFEIIKLSLVTEKHITGNSWESTLMKLNDSISNATDPDVLVNYASFVRYKM